VPSRVVVVGLLVLAVGAAACSGDRPDPPPGARRLTISTPDGATLDAVELGRGDDVAVLSHGATGTKEDFYGLASALAEAGWRVIAYDARGVGDSTGPGTDRPADLRAVVAWARAGGQGALVLAGGSLGASLSIALAAELEADAVVALSPPAGTFGALDAARNLGGIRVLVIAAEDDLPYADDARSIAAEAGVSPTIVDGEQHGAGVFRDHPGLLERVVRFAAALVAG
jgi:pimeloyl-ACP methyl ester carboxylesterase